MGMLVDAVESLVAKLAGCVRETTTHAKCQWDAYAAGKRAGSIACVRGLRDATVAALARSFHAYLQCRSITRVTTLWDAVMPLGVPTVAILLPSSQTLPTLLSNHWCSTPNARQWAAALQFPRLTCSSRISWERGLVTVLSLPRCLLRQCPTAMRTDLADSWAFVRSMNFGRTSFFVYSFCDLDAEWDTSAYRRVHVLIRLMQYTGMLAFNPPSDVPIP